MIPYPKIETLFNRDERFKVIPGDFRREEFAIINEWVVTEKIDGTNIRVQFSADPFSGETLIAIRGKSDNAQVPQPLFDILTAWAASKCEQITKIMSQHDLMTYCLYGEGYGPKIQSGGYYRADQGFILFDVNAGGSWLDPQQVLSTAMDLEIDCVPVLGVDTTEAIVDLVRSGTLMTTTALETRPAEGVVCRPRVPLTDRRGERVIWKLKAKDFAW